MDWGLLGTFPREDRLALMQLILGVRLGDAKRLHNNVGALLDHGLPSDPVEVQKIDDLIAEVIKPKAGRGSFDALDDLLFGLIERGTRPNIVSTSLSSRRLRLPGNLLSWIQRSGRTTF